MNCLYSQHFLSLLWWSIFPRVYCFLSMYAWCGLFSHPALFYGVFSFCLVVALCIYRVCRSLPAVYFPCIFVYFPLGGAVYFPCVPLPPPCPPCIFPWGGGRERLASEGRAHTAQVNPLQQYLSSCKHQKCISLQLIKRDFVSLNSIPSELRGLFAV